MNPQTRRNNRQNTELTQETEEELTDAGGLPEVPTT